MTIVNAAGRAMTDVTDDSQLCDVTDDQKPPGTRSYLTVGLPDPHPGSRLGSRLGSRPVYRIDSDINHLPGVICALVGLALIRCVFHDRLGEPIAQRARPHQGLQESPRPIPWPMCVHHPGAYTCFGSCMTRTSEEV
jgi:hypothetical protein